MPGGATVASQGGGHQSSSKRPESPSNTKKQTTGGIKCKFNLKMNLTICSIEMNAKSRLRSVSPNTMLNN